MTHSAEWIGRFPASTSARSIYAADNWPPAAARRVLCDWLAARGTSGWETLLPALSAQPSDDIAQRAVTCCAC